MADLKLVIPKGNVPDWLKSVLMSVETWARNISGSCLVNASVYYDKLDLDSKDIPAGKINWPEWIIPLSLPAEDVQSVDPNYTRCSGVFCWDASGYPITGGKWYFEASMAISDAAGTITCHLMGSSEIGVVTRTGDTTMDIERSAALTMPVSDQNLYVEFKTSNASYTASFSGARLVFVPD